MSWRRQLAVASPVSIAAVGRAFIESLRSGDSVFTQAQTLIAREFASDATLLTDSGTSALVLALRLAARPGGVVGFPGYACVDLAAAARYAGVRVRLYDLDPATLGPDLASIERMMHRGVDAVVVAHLFGYPADVPAVRRIANAFGATVIEDAAQGAGGRLNGARLGSFGDLSVLSFGRGKGLCAGGGGALLGFGARWAEEVRNIRIDAGVRGIRGLAVTGVQWGLGRPWMYSIPSSIPGLHLGEMVFHEANEPIGMSRGSESLLRSAFALEANDLRSRLIRAQMFRAMAIALPGLGIPNEISGAESGYLRYAVQDISGTRASQATSGILRSYPRTLAEQPELAPVLLNGEATVPGAAELRRTLFTLPTHRFVGDGDMKAIAGWMAMETGK